MSVLIQFDVFEANVEFFSHILIQLYIFVRSSCHWSKPINGTIGSQFIYAISFIYSSELFTSFQVEPFEYSPSWVITCQTKLLVSLI